MKVKTSLEERLAINVKEIEQQERRLSQLSSKSSFSSLLLSQLLLKQLNSTMKLLKVEQLS